MIKTVEIRGFRALKSVRVPLEPFQVLVGPNASGKSTFFDALAFVRDLLQVGLEGAVHGSARLAIPMRAADPIDLTWQRQGNPIEIAITAQAPEAKLPDGGGLNQLRYELVIDVGQQLRFASETLWLYRDHESSTPPQRSLFPSETSDLQPIVHRTKPKGWRKVVSKTESGNADFKSESSKWNNMFHLGPTKSALASLSEDEARFPLAIWLKRLLMDDTYVLALNAEAMRLPSPAGSGANLLPDGSNLPWVVFALEQQDPERLRHWVAHLQTSLPDVKEVRTREKPEDRSRYLDVIYANGLQAPSWLLSDGTLRMMALTLLAYAPKPPRTLLIEEPENGIHPQAIETVVQSLRSVYDAQVFLATHSPLVLSLIDAAQLLCFGKTKSGAIDVVRGPEHPDLAERKAAIHLGDLLALGVLG